MHIFFVSLSIPTAFTVKLTLSLFKETKSIMFCHNIKITQEITFDYALPSVVVFVSKSSSIW